MNENGYETDDDIFIQEIIDDPASESQYIAIDIAARKKPLE